MRGEPAHAGGNDSGGPADWLGLRALGDGVKTEESCMKYVCLECGEVFDYNDAKYDVEYDSGEGSRGGIVYSTMICPVCGSEDVEEAKECPVCGEYHGAEDDICDDCAEEIKTAWNDLLAKFPDWADAGEIARYIAEELE